MFPADVQLRSCAPAVYLSRENVAVYTTGQLPGEPWSARTAMPLAARVHAPVLIRRDRQQSPACSRWNAGARVPAFCPGRILAAHLAARPAVLLRSIREPRCSASHLPPAAITYGFACSAFVSRAPLVPLETGGGGGGTSPLAPRGARLWAPRPPVMRLRRGLLLRARVMTRLGGVAASRLWGLRGPPAPGSLSLGSSLDGSRAESLHLGAGGSA